MPKVRFYPHRIASPSSVQWSSWWVEQEGRRSPLGPKVDAWDYAAELAFGMTVTITTSRLLDSTGLANLASIELIAIADCRATQRRAIARVSGAACGADGRLDVRLELDPGQFASEVQLTAHLVLSEPKPSSEGRTAAWKGSRLSSSKPETVRLEGDAGRFPTEPVEFSALYLGDAPWTLLCTFEDLDESFMGVVRLLINTEHAVGCMALDPSGARQVEALLRTDVVRQLVAEAASRVTDLPIEDHEEGSVGAVLSSMTRMFLGRSLRAAIQLYREDPHEFELLLHEQLDPTSVVTR